MLKNKIFGAVEPSPEEHQRFFCLYSSVDNVANICEVRRGLELRSTQNNIISQLTMTLVGNFPTTECTTHGGGSGSGGCDAEGVNRVSGPQDMPESRFKMRKMFTRSPLGVSPKVTGQEKTCAETNNSLA